jgi:hypothetical protein
MELVFFSLFFRNRRRAAALVRFALRFASSALGCPFYIRAEKRPSSFTQNYFTLSLRALWLIGFLI